MTPDEMIEVIQAYKDGKKIQVSIADNSVWWPCLAPAWNFAELDYRVAPVEIKVGDKFGKYEVVYIAELGVYCKYLTIEKVYNGTDVRATWKPKEELLAELSK